MITAPSGSPLLTITGLTIAFESVAEPVEVVRDISFDIRRGEVMALVGESGSGKTVTALSILKLLPPTALYRHGQIDFHGDTPTVDLLTLPPDRLRPLRGNRIAMIFQEPMTSLNPLHTVGRQIGESLLLHRRMTATAAQQQTIALLERVGIDTPQRRIDDYPHQLSGGQRQRVMIAMALANEPELLIADEPTTALDVSIQAQILDLLLRLRRELGMALLLITHDLGIVRKMSDRICVMHDGAIVERGTTAAIFTNPQSPKTQMLLRARPTPLEPRQPSDTILLEADRLRVWFPIKRGLLQRTIGHIKAVDGVSLSIGAGRTLGIVGESGSGKTSLARALLRLTSSTGRILFRGQSLDILNQRQLRPLRRSLQVVFQDPFGSLSPRLTVSRIVDEGLLILYPNLTTEQRRQRVSTALQQVGLDPDSQDRYPHEFSGGQRQRIAIARALVLNPILVVLDEPTSALDATVQVRIIDLLKKLQTRFNIAYILISHDLNVIRALADDIVVMKDGLIVESGTAAGLLAAPQAPYTQTLLSAVLDIALPALDDNPLGSAQHHK